MEKPVSLYLRTLAQQQRRNAAALAAIESRAGDIADLEKLTAALRARGWKAEALVDTHKSGDAAACELVLLLSCNERELFDVIEHLAGDGVSATRDVLGDLGCSRTYRLGLARFRLRMQAYVHSPARVAA
jgi:hypothetical protein